MTPIISCIIPFLNGERFLREAVDSVLAQTFADWELLLVDDGSTDGSTAIARDYAARHPDRVRYLEHPDHANRGVCASRNAGIRAARGELIALLDSDDVWKPHKLEEQLRCVEQYPSAAMVYGRPLRWYRWIGHPADAPEDFEHQLGVPGDSLVVPTRLLIVLLADYITPLPSDVLIRRQAALDVGGFDEDTFVGRLQFYEDQAFFAKIFLRYPVFASSACWTLYRQHDASCVAVVQRSGRYEEKQRLFVTWLEGYLREHGVTDAAVWAALRGHGAPPAKWPLHRRIAARLREWISGT